MSLPGVIGSARCRCVARLPHGRGRSAQCRGVVEGRFSWGSACRTQSPSRIDRCGWRTPNSPVRVGASVDASHGRELGGYEKAQGHIGARLGLPGVRGQRSHRTSHNLERLPGHGRAPVQLHRGWRLRLARLGPDHAPPHACPLEDRGGDRLPSGQNIGRRYLAALHQDREMVVVDRPGFAGSEPAECVTDIAHQARALSPLLKSAPGQKILLVGQSYGAGLPPWMAATEPRRVSQLALLSSYLVGSGPTARWLVRTGMRNLNLIPRDLRNAVIPGERPTRADEPDARGDHPDSRANPRNSR